MKTLILCYILIILHQNIVYFTIKNVQKSRRLLCKVVMRSCHGLRFLSVLRQVLPNTDGLFLCILKLCQDQSSMTRAKCGVKACLCERDLCVDS